MRVMTTMTPHSGEAHDAGHAAKLNWLRAGVLGANDGIVSVAGLVMGVAGATAERTPIIIAGVAGIVSGALSMAVGEYVSVSTQLDSEKALLAKEKLELATMPDEELAELTQIYVDKGLDEPLAREVAVQLTEKDALRAHADAELNLDPDDLANPWTAAGASFVSFALGALIPLLAILLPSPSSSRSRSPASSARASVAPSADAPSPATSVAAYSPWPSPSASVRSSARASPELSDLSGCLTCTTGGSARVSASARLTLQLLDFCASARGM